MPNSTAIHMPEAPRSPGGAIESELLPFYQNHLSPVVAKRGIPFCSMLGHIVNQCVANRDILPVADLHSRYHVDDANLAQWLENSGLGIDDFPAHTYFQVTGIDDGCRVTVTRPVEVSPGHFEDVTRQIWPPTVETESGLEQPSRIAVLGTLLRV